ncbi:hypothetical protein BH10PSE14_BH10PSE14_33710 [soil metagenome]
MILGIERVTDVREVEAGRFYLRLNYNEDPSLFQCIRVGNDDDDIRALWFNPGTDSPLGIEDLPDHGPVVALPDVHIRVDAPSMVGSNRTTSTRPGMFLVSNDEAFVVAPNGFRGWSVINISTGLPVANRWSPDWIAFSRWLLVIVDNGEEIPIASFGEENAG